MSVSPIEFRCSVNDTSLFCLNDGFCVEIVNEREHFKKCVCPQGTFGDYTMLHLNNCGVASYQQLLGAFVTLTIAYGFSIVYLLHRVLTRTRAQVTRVVLLQTIYLLTLWISVLFIFIQQGVFTGATVALNLAQVILIHFTFRMTRIGSAPIYGVFDLVKAEQFRRKLIVIETGLLVEQVAVAIPVIVFAAQSDFEKDPLQYNMALTINWSLQSLGAMIAFLILGKEFKKLGEYLKKLMEADVGRTSQQKSSFEEVIVRIEGAVQQSRLSIFNFAVVLVLPLLFIAMGSIPYQIWIWFVFMLLIPGNILNSAYQIIGTKSKSPTSSRGVASGTDVNSGPNTPLSTKNKPTNKDFSKSSANPDTSSNQIIQVHAANS
jgi:hypothetical protein